MKCSKCNAEMEKRIHRLGDIKEFTDILNVEVQTKDMYLFTCPKCLHREVFQLDPDLACS